MSTQRAHKRSRLVLVVAICSGLYWSSAALPVPAQAQAPDPATQLYVSGFGVAYASVGGPRRQPLAVVDIVDGYGQPVNGALVVGDWSGCFKQLNDSAVTDTNCWEEEGMPVCQDGEAIIWANKTYSCWGSGKHCSFVFTIRNVIKNGMTYVPVAGNTTRSAACN